MWGCWSLGNARSLVDHLHLDEFRPAAQVLEALRAGGLHPDAARPVAHGLDGVLDEVEEDLLQLLGVGVHQRQLLGRAGRRG